MKAIRIGLCVLFAFSVFAHGVVEVWSESILEIGASLLFIIWVFLAYRDPEITIQWNPLNWPFLGFIGIGVLQLVTALERESVFHSSRTASIQRLLHHLLPHRAGLSGKGRSREADLVSRSFRIFGRTAGNHPVLHVPRHDLLDPEPSRRRHCFWALCESQSLCRICGAGCACRISAARVPRCAPGALSR